MEDHDIGNLIYYILIFAVAIISWINSLTKKKKQHQATIPSPFPTQGMPVIPPPPPKKKKPVPPPVPKHTLRESYPDSFKSSKYKENMPVLAEEKETTIAEDLELNNAESFRKAIIYSEIMNRKEW